MSDFTKFVLWFLGALVVATGALCLFWALPALLLAGV